MSKRLLGAVFLLAVLLIHTSALALDKGEIDRAEGRLLRASALAQWNILEAMAASSSVANRAAYCGESEFICMGPDRGHIALELIAAGNSGQQLSILAEQFRYRSPQFFEKVRCHALGKGEAIRPYLETLRPDGMHRECVSDVLKYLGPTGRFPTLDAGAVCATAPEIEGRVASMLDAISRQMTCRLNEPVISVADEAFLYGMVMSGTPAWRNYCKSSRSSCDGVGLPQWELALSLLDALDTPDALASLARLYRFSSDAALSTALGCAVGMKGARIWSHISEIEASDLRKQCEREILEVRRRHPGKFDTVKTDLVCRPEAELEKRMNYYRATNPPTAIPDAMYEICN